MAQSILGTASGPSVSLNDGWIMLNLAKANGRLIVSKAIIVDVRHFTCPFSVVHYKRGSNAYLVCSDHAQVDL